MAKGRLRTGNPSVQYYDPSPPRAGEVKAHFAPTVPSGWLLCNGQEVSQTVYADLYAELGTTLATSLATQINPTTGAAWAAPTAGNFRIPDLRGLFLRGVGTNNLTVATTLGGWQDDATAKNGLTASSGTDSPDHSHGFTHNVGTAYNINAGSQNTTRVADTSGDSTGGASARHTHTITIGAGDAETRPQNKGVNWIIRCFNPTVVMNGMGRATSLVAGAVGGLNGALPTVGNINEIIYLTQSTLTNVTGASTAYGNVLTINNSTPGVTNGLYLLSGQLVISANGSTSFSSLFAVVSDFSNNVTTDHVFPQNMITGAPSLLSAPDYAYTFVNQPINVTNGSNKYIKVRADYASGTPVYRYGFRLIRIG